MSKLTKEDLIDLKNVELLREIKSAMELKSEIDVISSHFHSRLNYSRAKCIKQKYMPKGCNINYSIHAFLFNVIEMIDRGELVFKEDLNRE